MSWTQVCDLQLGFEQSPLSVGSWGFSGAGQPHLGAHVWPSETGWFLCQLPSPRWEHQGRFMAALPCRARTLALTSPDHSHPGASLCHGPHQLQRKVPPPPPSGSCETSPVLEENGKQRRRGHNWALITWNILAKTATSKLLLSHVFLGGDLSPGRFPPMGNIAVIGHCSSFLRSEKCTYSQT